MEFGAELRQWQPLSIEGVDDDALSIDECATKSVVALHSTIEALAECADSHLVRVATIMDRSYVVFIRPTLTPML